MVALIFVSAFGTLAVSFWPYMIPYVDHHRGSRITSFHAGIHVLGEGLFVFPLMLVYAAISYRVFRGKVSSTLDHY